MGNSNEEKQYTLTINIADRGTKLLLGEDKGDTSSVGHIWYEIAGGENDSSYGFAPETHGKSSGPGHIYKNDSDNYATRYYQGTIVISKEQYDTLAKFGDQRKLGGKEFDFDTEYKGLKNSCVDYTWSALHEIGINPKDFEGQMWPTHNADDIDKILYAYTHGDTKNWNESLPDAGGYNATYGTKHDDILSNGDKDGYLFGGEGNDTYKVNANDAIYDSDNKGKVYFDATLLSGVKHKVSEGVYEDAMFTYTEEAKKLTIAQKADPSKYVTIENWDRDTHKALGIELSDEKEAQKPLESNDTGMVIMTGENVVSSKEIEPQTKDYELSSNVDAYLEQFKVNDSYANDREDGYSIDV